MSNRNDYRNWTPEVIVADTKATWDRMKFNGIRVADLVHKDTGKPVPQVFLDYDFAVERLGLKLVEADKVYSLDAEGKPIIDPQTNKEVVEKVTLPVHDWSVNVTVTGFTDSYGTPIPKGKQYFINEHEAPNRQPTPSNYEDLASRLDHWVFNLEALIKDENGGGQNEQHRCMAVVFDQLTGRNKLPAGGIPTLTLDGVSLGAAGSIDTGKKKDAKDDLSSNHEILAPQLPYTYQDYVSGNREGYGAEQKQARAKILREMQGVCKRIALRMAGTNIKGSKFGGYDSNGNVQVMADRWAGLDELVNMAFAYVNNIPQKSGDTKKQQRPVKVWEVAVAYALWSLRESEPLQFTKVEDVAGALAAYEFPEIDLEPFQAFLSDLNAGAQMNTGPLHEWCRDRVTDARLKDTDESSFAQVCRALKAHLQGEEVSPDINKAAVTGRDKEKGNAYFFFGGGDRGPIVKPKKASA